MIKRLCYLHFLKTISTQGASRMAHSPDKLYQAAQIYAARNIVSRIRDELIILQEAEFFVDVDTMRDIIDPQGAAACVHFLLGEKTPADLLIDPNVAGLVDEMERMEKLPAARLAVKTLFHDKRFCEMLQEAIQNLQKEFQEAAGETPEILNKYFAGHILVG
jgi:hypothetical protein